MGWLGYSSAAAAAVLFGVQYVPVKKHEIHDGSVFQFFLCCGVLLGTFVCVVVRSLVLSGDVDGVTLLLPGFIGGLLWATSNALVIPLVKTMGLGVGFSMYHVVNLMTGYGVGRFGLACVGLKPGYARHPWLQDLGVVVLLFSLVLLLIVDAVSEQLAKDEISQQSLEGGRGESGDCRQVPLTGGLGAPATLEVARRAPDPNGLGEPLSRATDSNCPSPPTTAFTEPRAPQSRGWKRLLLSLPLAAAAGTTTGLNAVPFAAWQERRAEQRLKHDPFQFALSQALGVWVTSVLIYLGFATFMKMTWSTNPAHSVIRPALAAGVSWSVGNLLMLVAIQELGLALGYSLDAVGPIMVASLIAALMGEIRRGLQAKLFIVAIILQCGGVVLITLGSGR